MVKEKKEYTAFYLEKTIKKRVQALTENPNTMFDDASSFYRCAVKKVLSEVEEELFQNEQKKK